MLTLHPQSAMEHLHARFVAAEGAGLRRGHRLRGDRGRPDVQGPHARPGPARPSRWPGRPIARRSRSPTTCRPGPLAVTAAAGSAKVAAGGAVRAGRRQGPGAHAPAQAGLSAGHPAQLAPRDAAPGRVRGPRPGDRRRRPGPGRLHVRRQPGGSREASARSTPAQAAIDQAQENLAEVSGPGIDLTETEPEQGPRAADRGVRGSSTRPRRPKVSARVVDPLRAEVVALLDRLYGVVPVASTPLFTFTPEEGAEPFDLTTMVLGPGRRAVRHRRGDQDRLPHRPQAPARPRPSSARARSRAARPSPSRASWPSVVATCSSSTPRTCCGAGAPSERRRQGHADRRRRSTAPASGATTSRPSGPSCATRSAASTTCTSSTRPRSRSARTRRPTTAAASRPRPAAGCRPRAPSTR